VSEPHTALAIALARADLAYLHGALMRSDDPTQHWVFLQYAVMTSYETRRYFQKQVAVEAPEAPWSEETAAAARNAGKYFDDNRRFLSGVVDYFAELIAANRSFFLPEARPARWLDRLRRDMAVLLLDGVPVMTNVGGFFTAGVRPSQVMDQDELGSRMHDLAAGVGQTIAWVGASRDHRGPFEFNAERFEWWDAHTAEVLGEVFCGDFDPPLALAMLTIQNAAAAADRLSRTDCCAACQTAAIKHRMIVGYQSTVALRHLLESNLSLSAAGATYLKQALNDPHCGKLREPGYRKLRNGLLHLGLSDIPGAPGSVLTMDAAFCHYTGEDSPTDVVDTIEGALAATARALEGWCLTPPAGGTGLRAVLHRPPA
jgi:hypothetical protein